MKRTRATLIWGLVVLLIIAFITGGLIYRNRQVKNKRVAEKLERIVLYSGEFNSLLIGTSPDNYFTNSIREDEIISEVSELSGSLSGRDQKLTEDWLAAAKTIRKVVCQCLDSTPRTQLLAAYDAGTEMKSIASQMRGRISTLR